MPTDTTPEVAAAIAAIAHAWSTYEHVPQTLTSPRPDPTELLSAAALLRAQMPGFDPATGTLPWETNEDLDPEAGEGPAWVEAAFEVLYEVYCLNGTPTLANQAHHLIQLSNAVGQLITWHPAYDYERDGIVPATDS